jgi:hypothetical protein
MEMTTWKKLKEVRINYPSDTYADYYELRIKRTHNTTKPSWAVWKENGWGTELECLAKGLTTQEAINFRDNYKVEK